MPPFGAPILPFPLYVDPSVLENQRIAFNAGSLTDSIIMTIDDYRASPSLSFSLLRYLRRSDLFLVLFIVASGENSDEHRFFPELFGLGGVWKINVDVAAHDFGPCIRNCVNRLNMGLHRLRE